MASARANLISNGGFETAPSGFTGGDVGVTAGTAGSSSTSIPGWTAIAGNGASPNVYYNQAGSGASWIPTPIEGTHDVQLDSTSSASSFTAGSLIYTTTPITLNPGGYYSLTFSIATEVGAGKGGTSYADVGLFTTNNGTVGGTMETVEVSGTYSTVNGAAGSTSTTSWTTYTINFHYIPVGGSTNNLAFLGFEDDPKSGNSNISIDNVSLNVVPEYTHWAVFGLFGAVCTTVEFWRRKMGRLKYPASPNLGAR